MFLGVDELLKLVHEKNLVEDLCEREITNPEGCGFEVENKSYELIRNKEVISVPFY